MTVLVLGGTRYMGIHLVNELISDGCDVTIATSGKTPDIFSGKVKRKTIERQDADSLRAAFHNVFYDVTIDNLAYCSNDIRFLLDTLHTGKYIMTSTVSVYKDFHQNIKEVEMDTKKWNLKWCNRDDNTYDEIKRQAESALFQAYSSQPSAAVRFPFIFGQDDYTKRLFFYIEYLFYGRPINVDNREARLSFIHSHEAGRFLKWVAENPVYGFINASSCDTISLNEIIRYAENRIGKKALIQEAGEPAPLNGVPSFSLDSSIAENAGFRFQSVNEWVYPMVDFWVDTLKYGNL